MSGNKFLNFQFNKSPDYYNAEGGGKFVGKNLAIINSNNHPAHLSYEGVLKCSYGVENAIGLVAYGVEDWFAVIPRLGEQSINDVDYFLQKKARPTISAESRYLGVFAGKEKIHGGIEAYPDIVAHDDVHRYWASRLGNNIHNAIERIIQVARQTFGIKWSKDIWILRDFDLPGVNIEGSQKSISQEEITKKFASCLQTFYKSNQLENCQPKALKSALTGRHIMFDQRFYPKQIALSFLIDLVRNPVIWNKMDIIADESLFEIQYPDLIEVVKQLNENHFFDDNMKKNVIKLNHIVEKYYKTEITQNSQYNYSIEFNMEMLTEKCQNIETLKEKCKHIDAELDQYEVKRNNTIAFLGFVKKKEDKKQQVEASLNIAMEVDKPEIKPEDNENTDMDVERSTKSKRCKLG